MKTNLKLLTALLAAMSSTAFAQNAAPSGSSDAATSAMGMINQAVNVVQGAVSSAAPSTGASPTKEAQVFSVEKASGRALTEQELDELRESSKRFDEIRTDIVFKTKQLELLKLQAEIDSLKSARETEISGKDEALKRQEKELQEHYKSELKSATKKLNDKIDRLKEEIEELTAEQAEAKSAERNKVMFVTQVKGFGDNLRAQIYYQNNVVTKRVGDSIGPDMSIKEIRHDGVTVKTADGDIEVPMTSYNTAYYRSFKHIGEEIAAMEEKDEEEGDNPIPNGAIPLFGPGMMPPPIGSGPRVPGSGGDSTSVNF